MIVYAMGRSFEVDENDIQKKMADDVSVDVCPECGRALNEDGYCGWCGFEEEDIGSISDKYPPHPDDPAGLY